MMRTDHLRASRATRSRRPTLGALLLAGAFVVFGFAGTASATMPGTTPTGPSESTAPPTTEVADETLPDDTQLPSDETLEEEDEGLDAAPVLIVGFVALLAIASWWMVRRDDEDDRPSPPPVGEPEWRADQIAP